MTVMVRVLTSMDGAKKNSCEEALHGFKVGIGEAAEVGQY